MRTQKWITTKTYDELKRIIVERNLDCVVQPSLGGGFVFERMKGGNIRVSDTVCAPHVPTWMFDSLDDMFEQFEPNGKKFSEQGEGARILVFDD